MRAGEFAIQKATGKEPSGVSASFKTNEAA